MCSAGDRAHCCVRPQAASIVRPDSLESLTRSEQVPSVTRHVDKDGDAAVRLVTWFGHEHDAVVEHAHPRSFEVIDTQEKPNAARVLRSDGGLLPVCVRSSKQQSRYGAGRKRACSSLPHPFTLQHYDSCMYRALVMFPKSVDPMEVDALIEGIASSFKASAGSQPRI